MLVQQHYEKYRLMFSAGNSLNPASSTMELKGLRRSFVHRRSELFGCDEPDGLPLVLSFTWFDVFALVVSMVSFLVDTATDMAVAAIHFENGHMWYFGLTVAFVAVPTVVMSAFSIHWYVSDMKNEEVVKYQQEPVSTTKWTVRVVLLMLQFGPILRYFDSLVYGIRSRRSKDNPREQRRLYELMVFEDLDATMLRLFECFMEAAPQLLLQLYIIVKNYHEYDADDYLKVVFQAFTVSMSLVSLAWSLVSYQRSLRLTLPTKQNMSWLGTGVYFLWRFFVIAARVEAMALFASIFPLYLSIACFFHWFIMFTWILWMKTDFCLNRLAESGYNAILAVIFIFCYFNPVDTPTRFRISFYYSLCLLENTALLLVWYYASDCHVSFCATALVGHYAAFFLGIIFMVVYYLLLHPTGDIPLWRNSCGERKMACIKQTQAVAVNNDKKSTDL